MFLWSFLFVQDTRYRMETFLGGMLKFQVPICLRLPDILG